MSEPSQVNFTIMNPPKWLKIPENDEYKFFRPSKKVSMLKTAKRTAHKSPPTAKIKRANTHRV